MKPMLGHTQRLIAGLIILVAIVLIGISCSGAVALLNQTPIISSLTTNKETVDPSGSCQISCEARDPDRDELIYSWSASGGAISGEGPTVTWVAPETSGTYIITVTVADGRGGKATMVLTVDVLAAGNSPPFIKRVTATPPYEVYDDETVTLTCVAVDPDGDEIIGYTWEVTGGTIEGKGPTVVWRVPPVASGQDAHMVTVRVTDSKGNRSLRHFTPMIVLCACTRPEVSGK